MPAVAEVRNPARVTPIWMVARKLEESAVSLSTCLAFLCPSSAILRILASLSEMIAISDAAKKALQRIRTISSRISSSKLPSGAGSGIGMSSPFIFRAAGRPFFGKQTYMAAAGSLRGF